MPTLPKRLCIEPNCSRPVIPGGCRCAEHTENAARRRDSARQERASLYKTKRWESIRRGVLERQGLCVICLREGRYTPATVVDHIAPHRGDQRLFYDMNNLQGLCKACHDRKTAAEDGGFGRRRIQR